MKRLSPILVLGFLTVTLLMVLSGMMALRWGSGYTLGFLLFHLAVIAPFYWYTLGFNPRTKSVKVIDLNERDPRDIGRALFCYAALAITALVLSKNTQNYLASLISKPLVLASVHIAVVGCVIKFAKRGKEKESRT